MSDGTVDPVIERARLALRRDEPADPGSVDGLMRGVRARPIPRRAPARGWLRRRLDLSLTPLAAAALLLMVAGAGGLAGLAVSQSRGASRRAGVPADGPVSREPARTAAATTPGAPRAGDAVVLVHFAMVAPDAQQVALVGDFNGWSPTVTPLRRAPGAWWVEVPLRAGRYTYAFLLDGRLWVPDPAAPLAPEDGFGRRNSVVVVAAS